MGFRVRSLSREDLEELTEARSELETLVLRRAIEQNSLEWESEVLALHHRLERIAQAEGGDPDRLRDAWVAAHAAYNNALLSGHRNSRLRLMAESLRDAAELYRRCSVPLGGGCRPSGTRPRCTHPTPATC